MLSEWMDSWRSHLSERLINPVLGPFTVAWLLWNWRMLLVLFLSTRPIETRITYIDEHFTNINDMFWVPIGFAMLFSLFMPWLSLLVQKIQNGAISRSKKNKLNSDTQHLKDSVTYAKAHAELNRITAQDEITRSQQTEIEAMRRELEQQQKEAQAEIAQKDSELQEKLRAYQKQNDTLDEEASKIRQKELEFLREQLKQVTAKAQAETDEVKKDLEKKQKELEQRIKQSRSQSYSYSDEELESFLKERRFRLFYNPVLGPNKSKVIVFGKSGEISTGKNANENTWRVLNGQLELLQSDGFVHSRFDFHPQNRILLHTNDEDTKSIKGQYILPEW